MKFSSFLLALVLAAVPSVTQPQSPNQQRTSSNDTTVTAGLRYRAGGVHRFIFGAEYRDLWTAQIDAPILDMQTTGGGLTPTTAGGGFQTKSLRFRGNNGLQYGF